MTKVIQDLNILRKKSDPVESVEEAKSIIDQLEVALDKKDNGVGLAAIQIDIPKRVGVIKYYDKVLYLINAEFVEKEEEFIYFNEGCLSLPGTYFNTKRYKHYIIKNQRIEGDHFEEDTLYFYYSEDKQESGNDGLIAIAVQHEVDHFNGKLIYDVKDERKIKPIERTKKAGRNDKCPCGSGKKFKKCCLGNGAYD